MSTSNECTLYCAHYTVLIILCTLNCTHYNVHIKLYTLYCTHYTVHIVPCTLYRAHYAAHAHVCAHDDGLLKHNDHEVVYKFFWGQFPFFKGWLPPAASGLESNHLANNTRGGVFLPSQEPCRGLFCVCHSNIFTRSSNVRM